MKNILFKTAENGFWYQIQTQTPCRYTFRFIVVGTAGKFKSGEITAVSTQTKDWQFYKAGFPVLHVGLTSFETVDYLDAIPAVLKTEPAAPEIKPVSGLSRREMLKRAAAATFLLAGTQAFFPAAGALQARTPVRYNPYSGHPQRYNPYGETAFPQQAHGQQYNPYGAR